MVYLQPKRDAPLSLHVEERACKTMRRRTFVLSCILLAMGMVQTGCASPSADGSVEVDGHRFVDLQLPSGLLWAETNVGAEAPSDYGDRFAWGETKTKADCSQSTYLYGSDYEKMTRYNASDTLTVLLPGDDAATVLWGKACRMPAGKEMEELCDTTNCSWTWVEKASPKGGTVLGYEVKSKRNGRTLFFPASGAQNGKNCFLDGSDAVYWSATLSPRSCGEAFCLYFNIGHYSLYKNNRFIGASVRPVTEKKQ